ncbi:MAG: cupin domain-containing protein [Patescibacteria group bacterium]|jgi:mannose-6-phosphate isomerase-like protein (cupin superfamily)
MAGFITNIENETEENTNFRKVLYTAPNSQLVVMNLRVGEEIGMETHELDQFIRIERGTGKAILDGEDFALKDGDAVVIPQGTAHNILNTGDEPLLLYTVYSPPAHKDGTIHMTKKEAEADEADHHA